MNLFTQKPKRRKYILWGILLFLLLSGIFAASFSYYLYNEVKNRFSSRRWSVPARVFSSTVPVYNGQALSLGQIRHLLEERRYKEASKAPVLAGEFKSSGNTLVVHLRDFEFPGVFLPSQVVEFSFLQNRIAGIRGPKDEIAFLELEPVEIARLYGPERESRMLINIRQVPQHLIDAVVAIEDHRFYEHRRDRPFRGASGDARRFQSGPCSSGRLYDYPTACKELLPGIRAQPAQKSDRTLHVFYLGGPLPKR